MNCERSDCDNDAIDQFETAGPPEGTFSVCLCKEHAPITAGQASD